MADGTHNGLRMQGRTLNPEPENRVGQEVVRSHILRAVQLVAMLRYAADKAQVKRRVIGRLPRWSAPQWPRNRAGQRFLILTYHRVGNLRTDPWSMTVTPQHFLEHLEVLRQYAHPVTLERLSRGFVEGDLPDRSVAVTFDDAYADSLYGAKPLLERYEIPATVFVATEYIGHTLGFWWDELDRLLLQPGALPEEFYLRINKNQYRWKLGKTDRHSGDTSRQLPLWRVGWDDSMFRYYLCHSLAELLRPLTEGERRKVLNELLAWASAEPGVQPGHRILSLEEVVTLAQADLIEVGAHTMTHPMLSLLPQASQRHEIVGSKTRLEEILGQRVNKFAYPFGVPAKDTVGILREAGVTCACLLAQKYVNPLINRFQLPRVAAEDWSGEKFARWLLQFK